MSHEEFKIIYVATLPPRRGSTPPHSSSVGCAPWLPSQEDRAGRGYPNFAVGKRQAPLSRLVKVNISRDAMC